MLNARKLIISILLGLAGFAGSFYSLNFYNPPFFISIEWCDALPILAGMAFGGRYGLIAAALGLGAFYPLVLYPNNGWTAVATSILLALLYSGIGYYSGLKRKNPTFWNHPLFIYPLFVLIYSILLKVLFPITLSFNPPFWNPAAEVSIPTPILDGIIAKGFIILNVLILLDHYLLKLPFIRNFFGLEIKKESRRNGWIALGSFLGSLLVWFVLIIFNRILIDQTFPRALFQVSESHEIIALIVCLSTGFLMGSIICQYVESRLKAEDELEQSRESYRLIFDQAADGIFLLDVLGNYLEVNDSGCKLTGYTRAELLQLNMQDLAMGDEKSDVMVRLKEVNAGDSVVFERRMRHKDGSPIYVEINARKLADGRLQGLVRDISQRKRVEEDLKAAYARAEAALAAQQHSEENYRLIFEQAADGIFIADAQGNFLDVNSSGCTLLGYTRDEVLNLNMRDLVLPEFRKIVPVRFSEMMTGQVVITEQRVSRKNGVLIDIEIAGRMLPDGRFQGVVRDISSRKRAEEKVQAAQAELQRMYEAAEESRVALLSVTEDQKIAEEQILRLNAELELRVQDRTAQLEAANQELEAFAYSVSHDLKAPLRTMNGFGAILRSDYSDKLDEAGQNYLMRIQEAAQRMEQLINDLLNLSRVTRSALTRRRVDLSALACDIADNLKSSNPQRHVKFDISPDIVVEGDPDLLKIVMENLLNNAFKFTSLRELATIQVAATERSGERVYFVRDNGAGFDMAYAAKLFAPFQRLHGIQEFPGTGIGLVTVRRIITRHGGRIWPEAAVDAGATFFFTLP